MKKTIKSIAESKGALAAILVIQILLIIILLFILKPKTYLENYKNRRIVGNVEKLVQVNQNEDPVIAEVLDVDSLKEENAINAEIYKDARNSDLVLIYSDKMVVYRPEGKRIIYEGDTPQQIVQEGQQQLIDAATKAAKQQGLVTTRTAANAQVSIISDPGQLRKENPDFYALAEENDLIAIFPAAGKIMLYRASEGKILNYGNYNTSIN